MKKQLKTIVALLLMLVFAFALVSCGAVKNGGADDGDYGVNLLASENTSGVPEEDNFDDSDDFRIRFVYSYTAKVVNANGRTEYKKEVKTVASIYVPVDNNGFTQENIDQFNALSYNGYTFDKWYTQWDIDTQTGVAGSEFVIPTTPITSDITIYGSRGNIAGPDCTWDVIDANGNSVVNYTKEELDVVNDLRVVISGTGAMFNFANANEIDIPWYKFANRVTKVVISEGITEIGANSFNGFSKMKSIDFGENSSVTKINNLAFYNCTSSSFRSLKTPASLQVIGENSFGNTKLIEIVLNEGLVKISDKAFYGSNAIKTAIIPESLQVIGEGAFHPGIKGSTVNDHKLSKVYYLGSDPASFAAIDVGLDNTWFTNQPTVYYYTEDVNVGTNVDAEYSYWHYAEIEGEKTDIPAQYCYTVRYFVDGDTVTPIASLRIPVEEQWTFDEQGNPILDVNPDTGELVLAGVVDQRIVNKQAAISHEGYFFDWSGNGLVLGQTLKDDTKITCKRGNLLSNYGGVINASDSSADPTVIKVEISPDVEKRIIADVASMLARGEIVADKDAEGNVVKTAEAKAAELIQQRITEAYRIWDFAGSMAITGFWGPKVGNVTTLEIADGVTYIGSFTFSGLTNLTSVVIPSSVKEIAPNAFDGCANLAAIYYDSADISQCVGLNKLTGTRATVYAKAYGPTGADGSYWTDMDGKKLAWTLKGRALTIGGDAEMVDLPHAACAPWIAAKDNITTVSFANNIVSLGENIINGYSKVTTISLPGSLKVIPRSALEGTALLNNRSAYPDGVLILNGHLIKVDASRRNTELFETVHGVVTIAEGAFDGCDNIKRLFIAATMTYINAGAFEDSNIESVYIDGTPASWSAISQDAYLGDSTEAFFRSDSAPSDLNDGYKYYVKSGKDYVVWGCNCVYGKWHRTTEPTCMTEGVDTRYCIYDARHTETRTVPKSTEHVFEGKIRIFSEANCVEPGYMAVYCSIAGCTAHDTPYVNDRAPAYGHSYKYEYVLEEDGSITCKLICVRATCKEEHEGNTIEHTGLVWNEVTAATVDSEATGYFTCSVDGCAVHGSAEKPIEYPFHTHVYGYSYKLEDDGTYTCTIECQRATCKGVDNAPEGALETHYGLTWVKTSDATDTEAEKGYFVCLESGCSVHGSETDPIDFPEVEAPAPDGGAT